MKLPKAIRISGIVLIILALIIVAAVFLLAGYAEKIVDKYMQEYYEKTELSQVYDIEYEGIGIGLISGKINLKGVKITPRSTFYEAPDSLRFKYPILVELKFKRLAIAGLKRNLSGDKGRVSLESIGIDEPSIRLINHLTKKEKLKILELREKGLPDSLTKKSGLPRIILDELLVSDGHFEYFDHHLKRSIFSVDEVSITGNDLDLEPNSDGHVVFAKKSGSIKLDFNNVNYLTTDGFYQITFANVEVDLPVFALRADGFRLKPLYDKASFGIKFGRQTDRMDLTIKHFEIHDLDIDKWVENGQVWISEIIVDGVNLDIFRDKSVEPDLTIRPKLPQEALAEMALGLNIGRIALNNAEIFYQEQLAGATEAGKVPIVNMTAVMHNVTNIDSVKKTNGYMKWELTGKLFGHGYYEVLVDFHGSPNPADFSFSGSIGGMEMTELNQMLVPNEHIRIDSGYMVSTNFSVNATRERATGEMHLQYKDLKITLLKDKDEAGVKDRGLLSSLANATIRMLKLDSSANEKETAHIYFNRDMNKGVFNYIVKSLLSGVVASAVPGKNLTPEEHKKKQDKEERKEERKNERKERRKK